jgi:arsenite methyltransferase
MSALKRLGINPAVVSNLGKKCSDAQEKTKETFGFKWAKVETYESEASYTAMKEWLFQKYFDGNPETLAEYLRGDPKIILDAGCGAGFSSLLLFGDHLKKHDYLGVDISTSVETAKMRFNEAGYPGDFLQCNLMELPIPDQSVDVIFSEGVLHHTDDTQKAVIYLSGKLKRGGRFLFYVYAKKSAIREFTDDFIREQIKGLSDEEAWEAIKPLTRLGIELGKLKTSLDVPEDIPYLGIKKGKIDLQRFFYWNLCKMYYRPEFSFDEMNHINFDWYRPVNCHRHTPDEVKEWVSQAGLRLERMHIEEAGITVIARKP